MLDSGLNVLVNKNRETKSCFLFYYHRSTTGTTMQVNSKLKAIMEKKKKKKLKGMLIQKNPIKSQHFSTSITEHYNIVKYT